MIKNAALAAAMAFVAVPAVAQNAEPEEPRTTYQITLVNLADGADDRWQEIMTEHTIPARQAAGLSPPTVHWLMAGPWQLMIITEMPDGLAALDAHTSRAGAAFQAALRQQMGSEAAVDALNEELDRLVEDSQRTFSHTHP
jgi:hypothetical protein